MYSGRQASRISWLEHGASRNIPARLSSSVIGVVNLSQKIEEFVRDGLTHHPIINAAQFPADGALTRTNRACFIAILFMVFVQILGPLCACARQIHSPTSSAGEAIPIWSTA